MIVHNVYFSLTDNSPAARGTLIAACKKYLADHPGVIYFSAGGLCQSLSRPVNDRDFDVALHVVFRSMADHDAYQQHPHHLQFIAEGKPNWKKVRVFDSEVE
jgi:Stress responsive A/B Barrel Domain